MFFVDNVLFWTVFLILAVALFGAIIQLRRRDICLKSFTNFLVYVQYKSGKRIWGELRTEASGLELVYRKSHQKDEGHSETSYVIFNNELQGIYLIIRFLDELTERNRERRQQTLGRSANPNALRRFRRRLRNIFNLTRDGVSKSVSSVVAAVTKTAPTAVASQQASIAGSGKELVEWFGNTFDPILENHIGRRIAVEVTTPEGPLTEFVGVFREYSADYLELLDVTFDDNGTKRQVDLLIPRKHSLMRHGVDSESRETRRIDERTV